MENKIAAELAPTGALRVGINLGNPLLVTGETPAGEPTGVAPSMGRAIADNLGVPVSYVTFASPGELADAALTDQWDIGLIADDPKRAETMSFSPAYVEIEATYLVPGSSDIRAIEDVDRPGVRVAVSGRSAYDLFLTRALAQAVLHRGPGLKGAFDLFVAEELEALAGLRPALIENAKQVPGARILDGCFRTVPQAIGAKPGNPAIDAYLKAFVAEATQSGLVADLLAEFDVAGKLQVAGGG